MKTIKVSSRSLFILLLLIFMVSISAVACEPLAHPDIQNNTEQTLNIYLAVSDLEYNVRTKERVLIGLVGPGKVLKPDNFPGYFQTYLIEAKDSAGKIVYSREFTHEELRKAGWKVEISISK